MFRYAEQGSIGFLWIAGTNPAVSMPDLARIRRILSGDQCFVVVSDGYRTETTELADVVLPAALGREDRHIHQRGPHRAPVRAGRRPAGPGPDGYGDLDRLCATNGIGRPGWSTAAALG